MSLKDDIKWFDSAYGATIDAVLVPKKYKKNFVIALACKEMRYLWSPLRQKGKSPEEILKLMVGDTIDIKPDGTGRKAFPRNRAALEAYAPNGKKMFQIAREALISMADATGQYQTSKANPEKFVHGFGIFQYDLQFFHKDNGGDESFFLEKKWSDLKVCLEKVTRELDRDLKILSTRFPQLGLEGADKLSNDNSVWLAIAYNKGANGVDLSKGDKQGHKSDGKFYGEEFRVFLNTVNQVI